MNIKWELHDDFRSPDVPPVKLIPGFSRVSSGDSKEISNFGQKCQDTKVCNQNLGI